MEDEVENNYEAEAAKDGWAPLEQWKGDPEDWKTAEQFVNDGKNINGILKKKVDRLDQRVEQLLESNKQLNERTQKVIDRERAEKESLIEQLKQARKQAVTDGDGEAFDKADAQINSLQKEPVEQTQTLDPLAQGWLSENEWYKTNDKLAAFADGLADRLRDRGYGGKAYYDELTRQVKETFPNEFENKNRSRASTVEDGGERVVTNNKDRTFANLPKDAKDAFAQFAKDIPGFTKDQFVSQYDWE